MSILKSRAACVALVAVIVPLICVEWIEAQKTSRNSYQQVAGSSGSAPQSVYGGYNGEQQSQQSPAAPVRQQQQQRRTQQSYQQSRQPARQPPAFQQQPQQQQEESYSSSSSSNYDQQAEAAAEPPSYGAVQGTPGQDFPNYSRVPKTSFSCDGQPYDYGMYADEETGCQAYHVCYNGRKDSFLCGPGTVFNQRILHCDYWYSVECSKSSQYYGSNAYMGSSQPEPGPAEANASPAVQRPSAQSSYKASASSAVNRPAAPSQYQRSQQAFSRNTQQVEEGY